jgi:hypothetical protein
MTSPMDPARDFLTPHRDATRLVPTDRPRPRGGRWMALARGVGFVALFVTVCSPLWGLAVFFTLH